MIEWISVENFRGISRTPKPLPLSKFTVLIGLNGSGKSALLEALYMLPPMGLLPLINHDRAAAIISAHLTFSGIFYRYGDHAMLSMGMGDSKIEIELLERPMTIFQPEPEFYRLYEGHFARMKPGWQEVARMLDIDPGKLPSYSILVTGGDDWRRKIAQGLATPDSWNAIVRSGIHTRLVRDFVRSGALPEEFTEVLLAQDGLRLRSERGNSAFYVRLEDAAAGLRSFLTAALWIGAVNPRLVLWDDFEANAHPSLIAQALRWLSSLDSQVVMATHSIDVLYELVMGNYEFSVLRLRRSPDDELTAERLDADEVEKYFEGGMDPRKVFG